jgi:hypothetical protein
MAIGFAAAIALAICAPLRPISGDTVPGRLGAAVLRCTGGFDLGAVDWIAERAAAGRLPYWARRSADRIVSVFGPGPAVVGAAALPALADSDASRGADGGAIDDAVLRQRERFAAAALLGLATALLVLASCAQRRAAVSAGIGILAAASFAGAATLGQGLWQASVALPFLVAALAALTWRRQAPRAAVLAPALLVASVLLRPTIAPLAAGLGAAWWLQDGPGRPGWPRRTAIALGIAALAAAPLIAWNLIELGGVLPTQQLEANARVTDHVFVWSRGQLGYGLGGLLFSPGRGWLWFAPIAVLGAARAARAGDRTARAIALGIAAQVLVVAVFHMWWGGICFGPRFLAEATWLGIWLACGQGPVRRGRATRRLAGLAIALTIGVGQLGLWGWRAEQWETRRNPDLDHNALWSLIDSPILAIATVDPSDQLTALDAPDEPAHMVCQRGMLRRRN